MPWIVSIVAIIVTDPFDLVVTSPFWLTIATNSFVEDQTTSGSSILLLFLSMTSEYNWIDSFGLRIELTGVITIYEGTWIYEASLSSQDKNRLDNKNGR